MSKIKIVWICHFSNKEVREKLPLSSFRLINTLKRISGIGKVYLYQDFAPWISTIIREIEKFDDVELHIIAPYFGLNKFVYEFQLNKVYYHFFRPYISLRIQQIFNRTFKPKRNYRYNRFLVKRLLKKIKPDIVNLFGAENPYYSITALEIKEIPVYVLLQTVLSAPFNNKHNYLVDKERLDIEKQIFLFTKYFGTASRAYYDCVIEANSNAKVFEFWFPTEKPPMIENQVFQFEFVFFGSELSESKGVEDAIEAFSIVHETFKNARLNIIGSCSASYKELLLRKISSLCLTKSIVFSSYFPLHNDMFRQVKKAKIALLPHKIDVISTTIREAMLLGIPLITYKTTGTPFLNTEKQTVLISNIGDIEDLAKNMLEILNNPELSKSLIENAKHLAENLFDNTKIVKKFIEDNRAIINHYRLNAQIPDYLLFKPEKYPIY